MGAVVGLGIFVWKLRGRRPAEMVVMTMMMVMTMTMTMVKRAMTMTIVKMMTTMTMVTKTTRTKLQKIKTKAPHLCRGVAGAGKNGEEVRRVGRCRELPERK